jgi:4-hydroxy-tetrahydrodipicolinate synthase
MSTAIRGFIPAVVTPFDSGGNIQLGDFETIIRWFLDINADGICLAGDNGESWALSIDERRDLLTTSRRVAGDKIPVILGASAATTKQAIKYAELAAAEGAGAILLMPQTYVLKASRAEMTAHFRNVAAAVNIPIVAYNSPRRSGIAMSVDDIAAICDVAPVVALKESTRDVHHLSHVIRRLGQRIAVMTGPASYIFLGAALGAAGFIATGPELLAKKASRLMEVGRSAPTAEYRELHHALSRIYEFLMTAGTWPAALKASLNMIGLPAGVPREPVQALQPPELEKLRTLLQDLNMRRIDGAAV